MKLIIGGAYQGKCDYARSHLNVSDIYECSVEQEPDWNAACVSHLERYIFYCVRNHLPPRMCFLSDAVLIADDISCGIVPMDPVDRLWREETGRYLGRLAKESTDVYRIFCGLSMKLK